MLGRNYSLVGVTLHSDMWALDTHGHSATPLLSALGRRKVRSVENGPLTLSLWSHELLRTARRALVVG